jgi:hypothetical protein
LKHIRINIQPSWVRVLSWIIITFIFLGLILVYAFFEKCLNWTAIAALASFFVLVWAVFQQAIIKWLNRPVIFMPPYKHEPPLFRPAPEIDDVGNKVATGYYLTIELLNMGKTVAYHAQPHITGFWIFQGGRWHQDHSWIPVGLKWVFDEILSKSAKEPTEEKDLVPTRPYFFNLLKLSTSHPDEFVLLLIFYPTAQPSMFPVGRYCFEITVTAENSKSSRQYYEVIFRQGGCNEDFDSVKQKVHIQSSDKPPQ